MDNATRRELLYKARAAGYPGSILDVFAGYEQGKDVIAEFQQQQQMQQMQQQQMPAQQSTQMQQAPQMPAVPSSPTPAPNFTPPQPPAPIGIQSQDTQMGIVSGQSGPNQGRAIFATGGFTNGGPGRPSTATAADSSLIANNANQVINFYKNAGYTTTGYSSLPSSLNWVADIKSNSNADRFLNTRVVRNGQIAINPNTNQRETISANDYYKDLGNHKFKQREFQTGTINMDAPMQLYDDRIMPQYGTGFELDLSSPTSSSIDAATVWNYDKLAVTPWSKLTDAQKIKRLEKFGGSGTPYTDKASIKQAIQNFKNPVPVRLDMKEATGFPMPQVDIKPQITSLPIPQTTKQRVVVNTPEGDKIRVQDIKTKKFLGWEDAKGLPSDVENPSGNASQDFPEMRRIKTPAFAYGGFKEKKCYTCVGRKRRV
jgi:hypothetical protein